MIDGNDGPHRHGSGCDSIRIGTLAGSRERTERRPERGILRFVIFSKHEINETRVINPVFLSSMFINANLALDVPNVLPYKLELHSRAAALQWLRIFLSYTPILLSIKKVLRIARGDMV